MARDRDRDSKSQSEKFLLPYGPRRAAIISSSQAPSLSSGVLKPCRERGGGETDLATRLRTIRGKLKNTVGYFGTSKQTDAESSGSPRPTHPQAVRPETPTNHPKKKSYCREYFRQYDFIKTYFRPALRRRGARTAQPFGRRPDGTGLPDNPDNRRTNRYPTLVVALI